MHILQTLIKIVNHGLWSEKCEASKAILYLYHAFQMDFVDPLESIIFPQLNAVDDDAWQVRSQMIANLAIYRIYHMDILHRIVLRLLYDTNDMVKRVAIATLITFGISSKEVLKNLMKRLKLLDDDAIQRLKKGLLEASKNQFFLKIIE